MSPYGYEVGKFIELYEDKSNGEQSRTEALIVFTHIYYSNYLALLMVARTNNKGAKLTYFCESKAKQHDPSQEAELFVAWLKLIC